jgi:hypothetical protein
VTLLLLGLVFGPGCDSVLPGDPGTLIIEAYLDVGKPLPDIRVFRAAPLTAERFAEQEGVTSAEVLLSLDGRDFRYLAVPGKPGIFRADLSDDSVVPAGVSFELRVDAEGQEASAIGLTPLSISIEDVRITVSDSPVTAVLLDSLDLGLDSLNIGLNTRTGFIYPVEVYIEWPEDGDVTSESWIETRLEPITEFSSTIVDFFLLPSDIFPEKNAHISGSGNRSWQGVYAVPVEAESDAMPEHTLRVALLRSTDAYAQHASSRLDPINREPLSNISGAVGFVGGISVDSIRVSVNKQ